jgi:hypothetical protein
MVKIKITLSLVILFDLKTGKTLGNINDALNFRDPVVQFLSTSSITKHLLHKQYVSMCNTVNI